MSLIGGINQALQDARAAISNCQACVHNFQQTTVDLGGEPIEVPQATRNALKVKFKAQLTKAKACLDSIPDVTA